MTTLLEKFERTGEKGIGVDLLRRKARERGRSVVKEERSKDPNERSRSKPRVTERDDDDPEYKAFIAERIAVPKGTNANVRKQMMGNNLKYN